MEVIKFENFMKNDYKVTFTSWKERIDWIVWLLAFDFICKLLIEHPGIFDLLGGGISGL